MKLGGGGLAELIHPGTLRGGGAVSSDGGLKVPSAILMRPRSGSGRACNVQFLPPFVMALTLAVMRAMVSSKFWLASADRGSKPWQTWPQTHSVLRTGV